MRTRRSGSRARASSPRSRQAGSSSSFGAGYRHQRRAVAAARRDRSAVRLIRVCKEDEGVGICAGLSLPGKRALLPDPAHRSPQLDQRRARRCGRVQAADLHDGRPPREKGAGVPPLRVEALRRAHRRADPRCHGHRVSRDARPTPTSARVRPRDRRRLRGLASGGAPDRAEASDMMRRETNASGRWRAMSTDADIVLPVYSTAFDWLASGRARSTTCRTARWGSPPRTRWGSRSDGRTARHRARRRRQPADEHRHAGVVEVAAPRTSFHFVCQNGTYEANGGHPIPNMQVDFAAMARAAALRGCTTLPISAISSSKRAMS